MDRTKNTEDIPTEQFLNEAVSTFVEAMGHAILANPDTEFGTLKEFVLGEDQYKHLRKYVAYVTEDYVRNALGTSDTVAPSTDTPRRSARIMGLPPGTTAPATAGMRLSSPTGRSAGGGTQGGYRLVPGLNTPQQRHGIYSPPNMNLDLPDVESLDLGGRTPFGSPELDVPSHVDRPVLPDTIPIVAATGVDVTSARQRMTIGVNESGTKMSVSLPAKFDPLKHQWSVWALQVLRVLSVMKLQDTLDAVHRAKFEASTHQMVVSLLHEIIPEVDSNMFVSMRCEYPDVIWTALKRKYKSKDDFRKSELHRQFHSMRQLPDETVSAWVVRLGTVKSELQALSGNVDVVPELTHKIALVDKTMPSLTPGQSQADHATFFAELRQNLEALSITQLEDRLIQRADAFREHLEVTRGHAGFDAAMNYAGPGRGRGRGQPFGRGRGGNAGAGPSNPAATRVICTRCLGDHKSPQCPGSKEPEFKQIQDLQLRLRDKVRAMHAQRGGPSPKREFPRNMNLSINNT